MIQINGTWYASSTEFSITPGVATDTRRALSGEVWSRRKDGRDILEVSFDEVRHSKIPKILNVLYFLQREEFSLYVERQEPKHTEFSEGYEKGFRGRVIHTEGQFQVPYVRDVSGTFNLRFEIVTYENL